MLSQRQRILLLLLFCQILLVACGGVAPDKQQSQFNAPAVTHRPLR